MTSHTLSAGSSGLGRVSVPPQGRACEGTRGVLAGWLLFHFQGTTTSSHVRLLHWYEDYGSVPGRFCTLCVCRDTDIATEEASSLLTFLRSPSSVSAAYTHG